MNTTEAKAAREKKGSRRKEGDYFVKSTGSLARRGKGDTGKEEYSADKRSPAGGGRTPDQAKPFSETQEHRDQK